MDANKKDIIGIIGGGHAGLELFSLFSNSSLAQVGYVVDLDPQAPAVKAARAKNVPVFQGVLKALDSVKVSHIFEVTGSQKVAEIIKTHACLQDTNVIFHETAFVILQGIKENNARLTENVIKDVSGVETEIDKSLANTTALLESIDEITSNMQMLALNARIEAARAGEAGKGFSIVAQEMNRSNESIRNITREIEKVSTGMRSVANQISLALSRLK